MGLIHSDNFQHLTVATYFYYVLQLASTSPIYFILKSELNQQSASLFSCFQFDNSPLEICIMVQSKVNGQLANLGADLTNTIRNEGYVTWSKLKHNSPLHGTGKKYLLPLQTIPSDKNEKA